MDHADCMEVNVTSCKDSWRIVLFQEYSEENASYLKGGDVIRLFHAEEGKFLTADTLTGNALYVFLRNTLRTNKTSATSSKALWEVEVVSTEPTYGGIGKVRFALNQLTSLMFGLVGQLLSIQASLE